MRVPGIWLYRAGTNNEKHPDYAMHAMHTYARAMHTEMHR